MTELRYEDATPRAVTVEGYACHGCGRVHAVEDQSRLCCATSLPCDCGGRREKYRTACDDCAADRAQEAWCALPYCEWDGAFPVGEYAGYDMHWSRDDLAEAILRSDDAEDAEIGYRLVVDFCAARHVCTCKRIPLREFCVDDFLADHLPDDYDIPREQADRIDAAVNAILAGENLPELWTHSKQRIDPRAIAAALGVEIPKGCE